MTPKDRMLKALAGEAGDGLAAAPVYLSLFLEDFERAYYIEAYRRRMRGLAVYPVDHVEDTRFRAEALYQSYGIFKIRPDAIDLRQGATRAWAERTELLLEGDILHYRDRETGVKTAMDGVPLPCGDSGGQPDTHADLWEGPSMPRDEDEVHRQLPVLDAGTLLKRGDFDLPRQVVADYGDRYYLSTIVSTPYMASYSVLGFQGLMVIQHDVPHVFHVILRRKLAQLKPVIDAWAAVGVHGIFAEEVWSGADVISPQGYEDFVFPYNQELFHYASAAGLHTVHYVCGDVMPRIRRIAELDVSAIALEESKKNFRIDIEDVVERIGARTVVFGNIDAVKYGIRAPADEITAEVGRQARAGLRAKGFVVSTGSPFPLDTNPRRIDMLVAAAHAHPAERVMHARTSRDGFRGEIP
jgi:hypothetical protein